MGDLSIEELIRKWALADGDDPRVAASFLAAALKSLVACRRPRADGRTCHGSPRFGQFCAGRRAMAELDRHLVSEGG